MSNSATKASAFAYAQSVLELAQESNATARIGEELAALADAIRGDRSIQLFLSDPSVARDARYAALKAALGPSLSPLVLQTIGVLCEKSRAAILLDVCDAFKVLLDRQSGRVDVLAFVPAALSAAELESVRGQISSALKKNATLTQEVDESLIGGIVLRIGDQLVDGSVKYQLQAMRNRLLKSRA